MCGWALSSFPLPLRCFSWRPGVVRKLWWTVFLAVILWNGFSRWVWLRIVVRQYSMGHVCSRVGFSSTSRRNTTSKTVIFITASSHELTGRSALSSQHVTVHCCAVQRHRLWNFELRKCSRNQTKKQVVLSVLLLTTPAFKCEISGSFLRRKVSVTLL